MGLLVKCGPGDYGIWIIQAVLLVTGDKSMAGAEVVAGAAAGGAAAAEAQPNNMRGHIINMVMMWAVFNFVLRKPGPGPVAPPPEGAPNAPNAVVGPVAGRLKHPCAFTESQHMVGSARARA